MKPNRKWRHYCLCNISFHLRQKLKKKKKEHCISFQCTALNRNHRYFTFLLQEKTQNWSFPGRKLLPRKKIATTFEDRCLVSSRCQEPLAWYQWLQERLFTFIPYSAAEQRKKSFQAPWSEEISALWVCAQSWGHASCLAYLVLGDEKKGERSALILA